MQANEYVKNVLITESNNFDLIGSRFAIKSIDMAGIAGCDSHMEGLNSAQENLKIANAQSIRNIRLLHAVIGMSTEVGELFEFLDKENLDFTNLKEEVGDAFWYCGIAVDELKLDLAQMIMLGRTQFVTNKGLSASEVRNRFLQVLISATKDVNVLLDLLKKSAFYGKSLDQIKFGDALSQFVTEMMRALVLGGFTVEEAMEINIAKLKKRYGDKFTEAAAITRNLDAERKILESNSKLN
jgi:hypothetical protein